jgi:hypothetical protein
MRVAIALAVLLFAPAAAAEQFVLVDSDYVHTKESHAYAKPLAGIPSNWRTPINYAEGTAVYHLVVAEKPSTENLNMGGCFVGVSYCCFGYSRFTKPGVYDWTDSIPGMWQYDKVDFTKPITEIPFIMRDRNAIKVDPGIEMFYGAPSTALYFPMKSHLTITIVSKGSTYMKPAPDAGPADVAPETSADTAVTTDTAVSDAVAEDTAEDVASATDTGAPSAADTGSDQVNPLADDGTVEGSACSYGQRGQASFGALVVAIALLSRRRPRR